MNGRRVIREQTEWCEMYWEQADDVNLSRVLLIGDSITVGYRPYVAAAIKNIANVDMLATSKSINDAALIKETRYVLGEYKYAAIHFNNGLHGMHIETDEYARSLQEYVELLMECSPGTPLIWANSTPVTIFEDGRHNTENETNRIVIDRNIAAARTMERNHIPTNDLYNKVLGLDMLRGDDGYHYNDEGKKLLGGHVSKVIVDTISVRNGLGAGKNG